MFATINMALKLFENQFNNASSISFTRSNRSFSATDAFIRVLR